MPPHLGDRVDDGSRPEGRGGDGVRVEPVVGEDALADVAVHVAAEQRGPEQQRHPPGAQDDPGGAQPESPRRAWRPDADPADTSRATARRRRQWPAGRVTGEGRTTSPRWRPGGAGSPIPEPTTASRWTRRSRARPRGPGRRRGTGRGPGPVPRGVSRSAGSHPWCLGCGRTGQCHRAPSSRGAADGPGPHWWPGGAGDVAHHATPGESGDGAGAGGGQVGEGVGPRGAAGRAGRSGGRRHREAAPAAITRGPGRSNGHAGHRGERVLGCGDDSGPVRGQDGDRDGRRFGDRTGDRPAVGRRGGGGGGR